MQKVGQIILLWLLLFGSTALPAQAAELEFRWPNARTIELRAQGLQALVAKDNFDDAERLFSKALKDAPDDYACNLYLAMGYLTRSEPRHPELAVRHLKIACKTQETPFNQYLLGLAAWQAGDLELASACQEKMPMLFSGPGRGDVPFRKVDLTWGSAQYEKMIHKIPEMARYAPSGSWAETWATGKLGGDGLSTRVLFGDQAPLPGSSATTTSDVNAQADLELCMRMDTAGKPGFSQAESYWKAFVFEMLNDDWRERDYWIRLRAKSYGQSPKELGVQLRAVEQATDMKVARFYVEEWQPYCAKAGLPTDPKIWAPGFPFPEEAAFRVLQGFDTVYSSEPKK